MTLMTSARPEVSTATVKIHCSGYKKDGTLCDHVVATVAIDEWEQQRALNTTLECRRCGRVEKLAAFM